MTPDSVTASEPLPSGMSEFSRITGVFFEPKKAFADIAARPKWLVPLLLVIALSFVYMTLYSRHVGWEQMMRQRLESNARVQQMPADQREQMIAMQAKMAPIFGYVGALVFLPVYYLVSSAVLLGIVAGIMSAPVKFKQVFAVMCYSGLVGLVSVPLAIAVMFLKKPEDFNMENPLMFNPGAFMDPLTTPKFLHSLASSLDLFVFWVIFLIATGLKAAAGKKLSFGGALFAVILPWAIYVLGKSALAGMFS
jgi:hypothetical protein